jgi:hypothetical protein
MVAMVQRLDASGFFFHPQLSVSIFLALGLKVFRNRFCCHGQSVAEPSQSKLFTFGHSLAINGSSLRHKKTGAGVRVECRQTGRR